MENSEAHGNCVVLKDQARIQPQALCTSKPNMFREDKLSPNLEMRLECSEKDNRKKSQYMQAFDSSKVASF